MLDETQKEAPLEGLVADDAVVLLQIIARLQVSNAIRDNEFFVVGSTRNKLVASLKAATGVDFDTARAMIQQALQQQAQAAQQQVTAPVEADPKIPVTREKKVAKK